MQDSSGKHLEVGPVGAAAATARAAHFLPLADAATSLAGSQEKLSRFLKAAVAARDPVLVHLIFKTLISNSCGKALITTYPDSMELEHHLITLGAPRPYVIPLADVHKYQVRCRSVTAVTCSHSRDVHIWLVCMHQHALSPEVRRTEC